VNNSTVKAPDNWLDDPKFKVRITSRGYTIFPIYYRMIPDLDPDRRGGEWYARARVQSASAKTWRQEMELDFGAASGGLVYPKFDVRRHVLLFPVEPQKNWLYGLAIDPGVRVTAALFGAITPKGNRIWLDEYYEGSEAGLRQPADATEHARGIIRKAQKIANQVHGLNENGDPNMEWDRMFSVKLIDPSSWRRQGASLDLQSDALRYIDAGIDVEPASNSISGGIDIVRELESLSLENLHLNGDIRDPSDPPLGWPLKFVNPGLKNYIREKLPYHFAKNSDDPDVKQPDHIMDCERYLAAHFRDIPIIREIPRKKTRLDKQFDAARLTPQDRNNTWTRKQ